MNAELEELACQYVLDQLDPPERAAFAARLPQDPELASFVRQLEATIDARVRALPQHEPPDSLWGKIERALPRSATDAVRPSRARQSVRLPWLIAARWGLAAVIAVSLATLAVQSLRHPASPLVLLIQLDANRSTATELALPKTAADSDARFIQLASLAESYWKKTDSGPAPAGGARAASRGYALFDPASRDGFIAVEQLPAIDGRKRFHLWTVDSSTGAVHEVGVLPAETAQGGLYSFSLPALKTSGPDRLSFFVTAEDADSGSTPAAPQPRGEVVLGKRARL